MTPRQSVTMLETDPADPKTVRAGATAWRLWSSDEGVYYATRGSVSPGEERAGCEATLVAGTPEERVELILAQSSIPESGD